MIKYNYFYIENTGLEILDNWMENSKIFSLIFICLCFLFVVNGANLIDGYNGLLGIHSLIILVNLFIINYLGQNTNLASLLFFGILILIIFLTFIFRSSVRPIKKISVQKVKYSKKIIFLNNKK